MTSPRFTSTPGMLVTSQCRKKRYFGASGLGASGSTWKCTYHLQAFQCLDHRNGELRTATSAMLVLRRAPYHHQCVCLTALDVDLWLFLHVVHISMPVSIAISYRISSLSQLVCCKIQAEPYSLHAGTWVSDGVISSPLLMALPL